MWGRVGSCVGVAVVLVAGLLLPAALNGAATAVTMEGPPPTEPHVDPPPGQAYALLGLRHAKLKTVHSDKPAATICPHKQDNASTGVLIVERGAHLPSVTTGQARFRGHNRVPAVVPTIWATKFTDVVLRNVNYTAYYKWNPPLYGDLDGDGKVACDKAGVVDYEDFALACGLPDPLPAKFTKKVADLNVKAGTHTLAGGTYNFQQVKLAKNAKLLAVPGSTGTIYTNQLIAADATQVLMPGWKIVAVAGPVSFGAAAIADGLFLSVVDDLGAGKAATLTGRFCGHRIIFDDDVVVH